MPYELRVSGKAPESFQTEQDAIGAAKRAMAEDPNVELEVIDLSTGRAAAPGADGLSREELRKKIGF